MSEVPTVGELLISELRKHGWTQVVFAAIIGRHQGFVSEIVHGKKSLTARAASEFGAALGTSAELWLSVQSWNELAKLGNDEPFQCQLDTIRRLGVEAGKRP